MRNSELNKDQNFHTTNKQKRKPNQSEVSSNLMQEGRKNQTLRAKKEKALEMSKGSNELDKTKRLVNYIENSLQTCR